MLFIKYLSDLQKDRLKELKEKYGNNERRIKRALEREKIIIGEDTTFEYLYKHKEVSNLGEIINKVLEKIEEDNREKAIKLVLIFKVSNLKKANIERTI
jgi:type I restriction enzyme M protein